MEDIYNLTKEQISELLEKNSFPKYRASQLWRYLYKNDVETKRIFKPKRLISFR